MDREIVLACDCLKWKQKLDYLAVLLLEKFNFDLQLSEKIIVLSPKSIILTSVDGIHLKE